MNAKSFAHRCIKSEKFGTLFKSVCEKFLKDVVNKNYVFDKTEPEKIIKFFSILRHSKGRFFGKPFVLSNWQKFIIYYVYGILSKKKREFTKRYILRSLEKTGKVHFMQESYYIIY